VTDRDGRIVFTAQGPKMVPVEGARLSQLVLKALHNIEVFDFINFENWLGGQPPTIVKVARACPPAQIYRVLRTKVPVYGVVDGYMKPMKDAPARVVLRLLGVREDMAFQGFTPEAVEAVTDAAREGKLDYGDLG
jgi:hypothetical protein